MTTSTSEKLVTFTRPFRLDSFDEPLPAGVYSVETDEELLEGISFSAYRRVTTVIHLHAHPDTHGVVHTATIDPRDLEAALLRDAAQAPPH